MIWIGLATIGICSAAFVAEVWPTVKKWWHRPVWERRTNAPKKKITVHVNGDSDVKRS